MTETPDFESPLRNPEVSEDADRELDKRMERQTAAAARAGIPEFAQLRKPADPTPKTPYKTAAQQRLPHAQKITENLESVSEGRRQADIEAAKVISQDRLLQLLSPTQAEISQAEAAQDDTSGRSA